MKNIKNIHFLGVAGSGLSGVAVMAKKAGYNVTGCDLQEDSAYLEQVKKENIKVFTGHNKKHLQGQDLLIITPAVLFNKIIHEEVQNARTENKLVTWEKFAGDYLQKGKKVIAVAGTHGKSTTAALTGLLFEKAEKDPCVIVGAKITEWGSSYRFGKSPLFIIEADEFNDNFLHYEPEYILLNNIEFDHPDYFSSYRQIIDSYEKFIKRLKGDKTLIVNLDSPGVGELIERLGNKIDKFNNFGYTLENAYNVKVKNLIKGNIIKQDTNGTVFGVESKQIDLNEEFKITIPGIHNVSNALGVIILARLFEIEVPAIKKTLLKFSGTGRRMELLGETKGIKVYDDYAHHPTAIKATLNALRQKHPVGNIWAVVEPHSYSRTKTLLNEYKNIFNTADEVVIAPIFKARDNQDFGVTGNSIVEVSGHKNIRYIDNFNEISDYIEKHAIKDDVIIVMGAGYSYKLAKDILQNLNLKAKK